MADTTEKCLNCGAPVSGKFCSNCGQSTGLKRITFKETGAHFLSSAFSFNGPLLSSLWLLVTDPGKVFREFIAGKRKSYYNPVSLFVLTTAVYLIVRAAIDYDPLANQLDLDEEKGKAIKKLKEAAHFMVRNINNVMLFLVFTIALNHKIFFRNKHNLAEYLSAGFYITSIYTLAGIVFMLITTYVVALPGQVQMLVLFLYILLTATSFHQKRNFSHLIRYFLIALLSILFYTILGFGFSLLVVLLRG